MTITRETPDLDLPSAPVARRVNCLNRRREFENAFRPERGWCENRTRREREQNVEITIYLRGLYTTFIFRKRNENKRIVRQSAINTDRIDTISEERTGEKRASMNERRRFHNTINIMYTYR